MPTDRNREELRRAQALVQSGNALLQAGRAAPALVPLQEAVRLAPGLAPAHHACATAFAMLGQIPQALEGLGRAIALDPGAVQLYFERAELLIAANRNEEAVRDYGKALELGAPAPIVRANRAAAFLNLRRLEDALADLDFAAQALAGGARAYVLANRAAVHIESGKVVQAEEDVRTALRIAPELGLAHLVYAVVARTLGRFTEALHACANAERQGVPLARVKAERAIVQFELGDVPAALAELDVALSLAPNSAETHWIRALCLLGSGNFALGWREYEWRFHHPRLGIPNPVTGAEPWRGQGDIAGRTIRIHGEQGFGDMIQFCRYIPLLARRGARVELVVPEALAQLMSSLEGVDSVVAPGGPWRPADFQAALLSLPLAFGTDRDSIPADCPYLFPDPERCHAWQDRLGAREHRLRIGIAWAGRTNYANDVQRSIALRALVPVLDPSLLWVSLQKDVRAEDEAELRGVPIRDVREHLTNFAETAALISALDLVICVDTAVAHLAGALGKPVWILLPAAGTDWRWMRGRDDSPWYASARLFRQARPGAWDEVIGRLARDVAAFQPLAPLPRAEPGHPGN